MKPNDCPQYDNCNVNKCPLDPLNKVRKNDTGNSCPISKKDLIKIGGK